jgi:L-alanine-DL-glutamate epimerase-like enolase superfamily enzyme
MKIVEARVDESVLPKKDKDWKFALAANPATEGWIVSIRAEDDTVGYGYASTMNHYGAPHEAVKGALDRLCKPLIGRDSREIAGILDDLDRVMLGNNQAKCGIDCALHDLKARRLGVPMCELFGGPAVREFASLRILPIKSPADMAKNARMLADKGVAISRSRSMATSRRTWPGWPQCAQSLAPTPTSPSMPISRMRPRMPSARST